MSSDFDFNTEREVEQLRIAIEFHEQQIGRLESRIRELKSELTSGRGELSLITGEKGAGKTTSSISIAEDYENPIISNLESLEDAFHAESWGQVEAILEEHSDQQFTILIDEYAGIEDGHEFVQEMLKQRHHVILVKPHPEVFHQWTKELADSEYYISKRGINGIFPPRRSFDTCEIPHFDFTKPPQAYPRAEFEDEDDDDLTQVSGVDEGVELLLEMCGYETIDDLRRATEHEIAIAAEISHALAVRIKADVGDVDQADDEPELEGFRRIKRFFEKVESSDVDTLNTPTANELLTQIEEDEEVVLVFDEHAEADEEPSFAEFFGLTQEEADAARNAAEQFAAGEFEDDDELPDDLFQPDERFPPQFHLDHLESQLDYSLGQVDGFFELDWSEKCDLAKLAVEEDLDLEATETIVQMSLASAGDSDA